MALASLGPKVTSLGKAVGRRKSAVAQVKIIQGTGDFIINGKPSFSYMQEDSARLAAIQAALYNLQLQKKYNIIISVHGGGLNGQSQAIKLAVAKALCTIESSSDLKGDAGQIYRKSLKSKGYLTTDARCKERKKYGLKKARKAPQFSKR
uniref:Small ribosomal subunit protein uS9c n=1 Tax=Prasiolopsis wulf-kochii TaxID=3239232 RepID=A0A097KK27_9CHLO|nr:ribosomal protein S9 [Prasiolopsis sp. SAG 84.81]